MLASTRPILSLVGQPVLQALCSLQSLTQHPEIQHSAFQPLLTSPTQTRSHANVSPPLQFPSSTAPAVSLKPTQSLILSPINPPPSTLSTVSPHPPTLPQGPLTVQYPFPIEYYKDREAVIYNMQAQPQGVCSLPGDVFNVPVRIDVLHRVVRWLRAMWRQGTHKAKSRGEVQGGGRKPWPQKGTGQARHGSIRSPIWVGGGAAHGPVPHSHAHELPLNLQLLGYKSALSAKANEGRLVIVDSLVPEPVVVDGQATRVKTKATQKQLQGLLAHVPYDTALLIDSGEDALDGGEALRKGAGNLPWVGIMSWKTVTVYHLLKYQAVVMTRPAAMAMAARLQAPPTTNPVMLRRGAWLKQQQAEYQKALEHLREGEQN